jgi:hypothetical protein
LRVPPEQELDAKIFEIIEDYKRKLTDRTHHHMGCVCRCC